MSVHEVHRFWVVAVSMACLAGAGCELEMVNEPGQGPEVSVTPGPSAEPQTGSADVVPPVVAKPTGEPETESVIASNRASEAAGNTTEREDVKLATSTRKLMPFKSLVVWAGDRVEITQGKSPSLTIETEEKVISLLESVIEDGTLHLRWKSGSNTLVGGPQTSTVTVNGKKIIAPAGSSVSISNNTIRIDGVIIDVNRPVKLIKLQKPVVLRLTVTDLSQITTARTTHITCKSLQTRSLDLRASGSGRMSFDQLQANDIAVRVSGSGKVSLAGKVGRQTIRISGSGQVDATRLAGQSARVTVGGSGKVSTAVTGSLDVKISGSGKVSYSGSPEISKSISGSGKLIKGN